MKYLRSIISVLFFIFFCSGFSTAGIETVSGILPAAQILNNASVSVQDNNYPNVELSGAAKVASARSTVIFSIDNASNLYFSASSTVRLGLQLTSFDKNGVAQTLPGTIELEVGYSPTGSYKDKSVYVVYGSHYISATIQYIKDGANVVIPPASIPQNLRLEVEQTSERYYAFNTSAGPAMIAAQVLAPSNELNIRWNVQQGAEEYELEWTYVNNYPATGTTPLLAGAVSCSFKDNSTRVRLSETHYPISLVYDQGYIVYRVRGIGHPFSDLNKELFGAWSTNVESDVVSAFGSTHYHPVDPLDRHEKSKNWQYSASYAEEGKKKEVVSYFDGSLRNRQSVTKLNTDKKTIVGETIYDHQGRGSVQVLPTPTLESIIKFYPDFNKSVATGLPAYSRNDFDIDFAMSPCYTPTLGMSTTIGSSKYYSAANTDKAGVQAYVPDAQLFPFSQVEFTPDNTGRIRRQSGVGEDHQLGTDHETQYFYGQPEQVQLDRMFGSEVGDDSHYKKNMVVDANGQISVSYLDQQGRVIATSLAGLPPANVNALTGSNPVNELTANYLKAGDPLVPNSNKIQDNALIFSKELLVANQSDYDFYYDLVAPNFVDACLPSPICYDCIYDMEISLTDACGTDMFPPVSTQVGTIDTSCGSALTFSLGVNALTPVTVINLPKGSYTLYKKLTISQTAIDTYTTNFINNNTCITPYQEFLDSAMAHIDTTACDISCDQCVTSLGLYTTHNDFTKGDPTSGTYDPNYNYMTQEAFDKAIKDCKAPCEPANLCESQYQTLLSDVSPSGQYAKYIVGGTPEVASSTDPLSLFYISNLLPDRNTVHCLGSFASYWRNPKRTISGVAMPYYYDEDGSFSKIPVTLQPDGVNYFPEVDLGNCITSPPFPSGYSVIKQNADGSYYVYPQELLNPLDFINEFGNHPDWAKSLVEYHPEYAYYAWCIKNSDAAISKKEVPASSGVYYTSDSFDDLLRSKNTAADASTASLLTGTGISDLLDLDPYFNTASPNNGQGTSQKAAMLTLLTNYNASGLNLKAVVTQAAGCGTVYYGTTGCGPFGSGTTAVKNQEWILYRNIYLAEKQKFQQKAADIYASSSIHRYNGCIGIGSAPYNPWGGSWPFSWSNAVEPCGIITWQMYKDKTKRFQNGSDIMSGVNPFGDPSAALTTLVNNAEYNSFLQTGQCPIASDLGFLLDDLAENSQLVTTGVNLVTYPAFTKKLYDAVFAPNTPSPTNFINYYWVSSVSGSTLTVQFKENSSTGTADGCALSLTLPGSHAWADVVRFSSIQFTSESPALTYNFTITAFVDTNPADAIPAVQVTVSGSTCLPLNGCSFPNNCGPSEMVLNVQNLFNGLLAQTDFHDSGVNINTSPLDGLYIDKILLPGTVTVSSATWGIGAVPYIGTISYTLSNSTVVNCEFTFSFVNTGYVMSNIVYFANVQPDNSDATRFKIDAWVGDHFEPMLVDNGASACFSFKACAPPPNLSCTGPGYEKNEDFIAGLTAIASQNLLLTDFSLSSLPAFAALYDEGTATAAWDFNSENTTTKTLTAHVNWGAAGVCEIVMQFDDIANTHSYSNIVSFGSLRVPASGNGSSFTMLALFSDGTSQLLNCTTECLVLAVCEQCVKTTTITSLLSMNFDAYNSGSPGFTSARTYNATCSFSDYPADEYHVEENITSDCSSNYYSATGTDHTNPGTGDFLLFNFEGAGTSEILWEKTTLSGILPYTNYIFSYWVQRGNPITTPKPVWASGSLQMEIDGTTYNTSSPSTSSVWEEVTRTWNSGNNTSGTVTLKIKAGLTTGVLGIDDISFEKVSIVPCIVTQADPGIVPVLPYVNPCVQNLKDIATANALASYGFYIDSVKANFRENYLSLCKNPAENLKMVYDDSEHHITLYYYDQAGNLVRTVPPAGVVLVTSPTDLAKVAQDRLAHTQTFFTQHTLITKYEYNSLNQLLRQATPDNDLMNKWELNGLSTLPSGTNIYGMAFSSGNTGFVVGDNGTGNGVIYLTTNGGTTWSPVSSLGIDDLQDIQMIGTTGYAIAAPGYLVKTTNTGSTWTIVSTPATSQLNDLYFSTTTDGIVIGNNGTVLRTTDGGTNWTVPAIPISVGSTDLNDLQFISTNGYIVGNAGTVLTSSDNGINWLVTTSPLSSNIDLYAVDFSNAPIGYVAGENSSTHQGVILKYGVVISPSTYGWVPQLTTAVNTTVFAALNMNSTGTGYAGGSNGKMYTTSNSGTTWTQQTISGLTANITEMHFPSSTIGYATVSNGSLLALSSGTWTVNASPVSTSLNGLYFTSTSAGYAVGDGGAIFAITGSGITWASLTNVNFGLLKDVCFAAGSSTVGYAVGATGAIIKTINGGTSWSTVTNANTTGLNAVYFTTDDIGMMAGNGGLILSTTNGGSSTLTTESTGSIENLNDILYTASGKWVVAGDNRTILIKSGSWSTATITSGIEELYSVYFVGTTGYVCGSNGVVFKSTNDGVNWSPTGATGTTETLREIYFRDLLTGYAMGDNGTIIKTIDGGINWITETGISGSDYFTAAFDDEGHALLAGTGTPNLNTLFDESNDHSSRFWYDRLGRLVVSQNGKQFNKTPKAYSYTKYDALGRITEVAETGTGTSITTIAGIHGVIGDDAAFATWLGAGTHTEITSTLYDVAVSPAIAGFTQENLRKRVSSVSYASTEDNVTSTFDHATHYSYDIHGNVKTLVQDNPALATLTPSQRYKKIDYIYDLVSGKVNQVSYQNGQPDAFYHQYEYDADNRITNVITSKDGVIWDKDANYFYYQHGPLARTELGDQKVQAMDYAYTIQGWIKGVNSNTLKETRDIGLDGETGSTNLNRNFAKDAFGYSLNYFSGDYASIATLTDNFIADESLATYIASFAPGLYNGNISHMVTAINDLTAPSAPVAVPQLTAYKYDQLNRINDMKAFRNINIAANAWSSSTGEVDSYRTSLQYDANGNILVLNRNGVYGTNTSMDELQYQYETIGGGYTRNTNKLRSVIDVVGSGNYATDIDNQSANNYEYDEIGNLIADAQEQIDNIDWTVYGKIKAISRATGSTKPDLVFNYDASGNRISKTMIPRDGAGQRPIAEWITTHYVRDAQGNVMSTYELSNVTFTLKEQMLYGSSRLGTMNRDLNLTAYTANDVVTRVLGKKNFELSNHLGNVLSVTSDRKLSVESITTSGTIDHYLSEISSSTDYGAWGDPLPGRNFVGANGYRYGFNGKENDNEVKGNGNQQDYGMRIYDPRLGRFLSVDPLTKSYPMLTPYQFASNRPIDGIDLDGLEHLKSDEARIEVTSGGVMLKIENMTGPTKEAWRRANEISDNWTSSESGNGQRDIGISKKIASFNIITPTVATSKADDVQQTPSSLLSQDKYAPDPAVKNASGKGTVSGKYNSNQAPVSASSGGGFAKGANGVMALVGLYQWGEEQVNSISWAYDQGQIEWNSVALNISIMEVNYAVQMGNIIPKQYQTTESLAAITNVVLQGVNSTKDPKIYEIGMKVYNTFNAPNKKEDNTKSAKPAAGN